MTIENRSLVTNNIKQYILIRLHTQKGEVAEYWRPIPKAREFNTRVAHLDSSRHPAVGYGYLTTFRVCTLTISHCNDLKNDPTGRTSLLPKKKKKPFYYKAKKTTTPKRKIKNVLGWFKQRNLFHVQETPGVRDRDQRCLSPGGSTAREAAAIFCPPV